MRTHTRICDSNIGVPGRSNNQALALAQLCARSAVLVTHFYRPWSRIGAPLDFQRLIHIFINRPAKTRHFKSHNVLTSGAPNAWLRDFVADPKKALANNRAMP
jgi:hypothetical protein